MTHDWINRLEPSPPPELATALRKAMRGIPDETRDHDTPSAEQLLRAGLALLERVLAGDCDKRDAALDLLAVDALISHAVEIESTDPNTSGDFPERIVERLAGLHPDDKPIGSR